MPKAISGTATITAQSLETIAALPISVRVAPAPAAGSDC